ncbi:hypothetical protein [Croceicoccus gelatinilyticus]|uniref:hypothetical protein n=1 Tax=Croceicoccus gelatinilyticus TaxID=2835536 RepID=UPI001BD0BCB7|nr:hypothetical protein [Croceicoccus gelatinilyticus]MBS7671752.1 hypothetical protein [Croceicoccus gelatinilyticus]
MIAIRSPSGFRAIHLTHGGDQVIEHLEDYWTSPVQVFEMMLLGDLMSLDRLNAVPLNAGPKVLCRSHSFFATLEELMATRFANEYRVSIFDITKGFGDEIKAWNEARSKFEPHFVYEEGSAGDQWHHLIDGHEAMCLEDLEDERARCADPL